jgi:23S rRNA G2445 N2-methylase RlmL
MSARRKSSSSRPPTTWMVATQVGVGKLAAADLKAAGATVQGIESDGHSDLVVFQGAALPEADALALAEDIFVAVGDAPTTDDPKRVALRLFDSARWQTGADIAKSHGIRVSATTGFRAIVRVRSERDFKRTELRAAVTDVVQRWRPRWSVRDPADLEIWVLESRRGRFRAAMRLSTAETRSRGGRKIELPGALRPTVAAGLVRAAGSPGGLLVDPFCGSGTVLGEALRMGWTVFGSDIDAIAVDAARANEPNARVLVADAVDLPLDDGAAAAVTTNPPFGVQHALRTGGRSHEAWWMAVLAELARIVRPGGRVVLLYPDDDVLAVALRGTRLLREGSRAPIRTLGQHAVIRTLLRS